MVETQQEQIHKFIYKHISMYTLMQDRNTRQRIIDFIFIMILQTSSFKLLNLVKEKGGNLEENHTEKYGVKMST